MLTKKEIERIQNTGVREKEPLREKTRQQCNRELLEVLEDLIEAFPEQRFGQVICNYIFPDYREKDPFYEEPRETLEKFHKLEEGWK